MAAIKKIQGRNILDEYAPMGIYNRPESREELDLRTMCRHYLSQRRFLEREVNQRTADKFVRSQYISLFQEEPPKEMIPPFVSSRITSYLMCASKLTEGVEISNGVVRDIKASWGDWAVENDYREFDEDVKLFFQAELLRRSDMAIAKKNDAELAAKDEEKKAAAPKPAKTVDELNANWVARIQKWYNKQGAKQMETGIFKDTMSRFRPGTVRQDAFDYVRNFLKNKKAPQNFTSLMVKENLPESIHGDFGYVTFAIGCHLDVFAITDDNKITMAAEQPVPIVREVVLTPAEKEAAKAIRKAEKIAEKAAAASTEAIPVVKKAVALLKKKPEATPSAV